MSVVTLCESQGYPYLAIMEAVEEFVDSQVDGASIEIYEATAKRLLGESLTHDEIMLGTPKCTPDDLIVVERNTVAGEIKFHVGTDTSIKTMLTRLKLGSKGLNDLYKTFTDLSKRNPDKTDGFLMAKAAQVHGLESKQVQIILTKMLAKNSIKKEYYLAMADQVLMEEVPTNTQGGAMPDRAATDGDTRIGTKQPVKRKKLKDCEHNKPE